MSGSIFSKVKFLINNETARHGSIFAFFSFLNSGIGFILLIILAKFIDPDGYGQLNLFNTSVTLISFFICLSTTSYFSVSYFQKQKIYIVKVVNVIVYVIIFMTTLFLSVLGIYGKEIALLTGISIPFLISAIFISANGILNILHLEVLRLKEKPINYGLLTLLNVVANFVLTLIFIVGKHFGWEGRAYAQLLVSIMMCIIGIFFLKNNGYLQFSKLDKIIFKETILYALPLIPHLFSGWLRGGFDRYIINYFHDTITVGYYGFASSFASIVTIAGNAFNATNSVLIFKKLTGGYNENCKNVLRKQTFLMIGVFAAITLFVIVGVSVSIPLFFPKYLGSVKFIFPTTMASFFWCIYLLYVNYMFYYKKTLSLMYITLTMSIIQAGVSLIVTRYNVLFTAYLSMIISAITALFIYALHKKILKKAITVKSHEI